MNPTKLFLFSSFIVGLCSAAEQPNAGYNAVAPRQERRPISAYKDVQGVSATEAEDAYKALAAAISPKGLDGPIKVLGISPPDYPEKLQQANVSGVVEIVFVVDEQGAVEAALVHRSVHAELDRECLDAVRKWRFAPMTAKGKPVKVKMLQRFPFVIPQASKF